ncbi:unnamed protein product, partial [Closterium sp. NIES-64]
LEAAMAWSNYELNAFEGKVKHCLRIRNQPDNELTHLLEEALHKLRGQQIQVLNLRKNLNAMHAENSDLVTRMRWFELMEARLREHAHLGVRGSHFVVARLQQENVCLEKKVEEAGPLEKMVQDLRKELDEVTQQRNGLRQQLRNTQEHRGRLSQQIIEAQDISLQ